MAHKSKLTVADFVARSRTLNAERYHWQGLDLDVLIRPRTLGEGALLFDESERLGRDREQYAGTPDAPGSMEIFRVRARYTLPCVLDPLDGEPYFTVADVDDLMALDMPSLQEILDAAERVSSYTKAQRDAQTKNSPTIEDDNSSSISPDTAATSASSPTPTPSAS